MKDAPCFQRWLLVHLVLDLAIDFPCALFNVEGISLSTSLGSHHHFACLILEAFQLGWVLFELEMPQLLFLLALRVCVEDFKQVSAFIDLPVSIGVDDFSKILHQSEVSSHSISESSDLAEFRNQSNLISSLSVFVDE
jgi:hypothetical protein